MRTFSVTLFALAAVFSSAYGAPVVLRDALEIEEPILAPAPANALNGTDLPNLNFNATEERRDLTSEIELEKRLGGIGCHRGPERKWICQHPVTTKPTVIRREDEDLVEFEKRLGGIGCHRGAGRKWVCQNHTLKSQQKAAGTRREDEDDLDLEKRLGGIGCYRGSERKWVCN